MTAIPTEQFDRVLMGEDAALSFAPASADGDALTLLAPATVALSDGAGVDIPLSPNAATIATDKHSLSFTIPAGSLPLLDTYTVTWTATVGEAACSWQTSLDVCGGHIFSIAQFRASKKEFAAKTAATVRSVRTAAEVAFEKECGVAFVPRGAREQIRGDDTDTLLLSHVALRDIYSLSVDGTAWTPDEIAVLVREEPGIVTRTDGLVWTAGSLIVVHYTHGYDRPPVPVRDAVLILAQDRAIPDSRIPSRAVLQATEFGNFRVSVPGRDGPFGIPEVDARVYTYGRPRPAVG